MKCTPLDLGNGVSGFVCGSRTRRPKCSTPGCGRAADLECDAPVERNRVQDEPGPKLGDARLHRLHNVVFYVWAVEGESVRISTSPRPGYGVSQTTTILEWLSKTVGTCDRPVCRGCAVKSGKLDFCAAHGRQQARSV